jgi:hypothetical protein
MHSWTMLTATAASRIAIARCPDADPNASPPPGPPPPPPALPPSSWPPPARAAGPRVSRRARGRAYVLWLPRCTSWGWGPGCGRPRVGVQARGSGGCTPSEVRLPLGWSSAVAPRARGRWRGGVGGVGGHPSPALTGAFPSRSTPGRTGGGEGVGVGGGAPTPGPDGGVPGRVGEEQCLHGDVQVAPPACARTGGS